MELIYKTLCEIKLEHEYFLTKEDGTNLFSESDPLKRIDPLEQAYEMDMESMNRDIDFDFPDILKESYKNYGLKLLPSYSGCKVLIRVNKKTFPDNSLVFEPYFPLPGSLDIFILFIKKVIYLISIPTNESPGRYLQTICFPAKTYLMHGYFLSF